jgi:hypothetical protein
MIGDGGGRHLAPEWVSLVPRRLPPSESPDRCFDRKDDFFPLAPMLRDTRLSLTYVLCWYLIFGQWIFQHEVCSQQGYYSTEYSVSRL